MIGLLYASNEELKGLDDENKEHLESLRRTFVDNAEPTIVYARSSKKWAAILTEDTPYRQLLTRDEQSNDEYVVLRLFGTGYDFLEAARWRS